MLNSQMDQMHQMLGYAVRYLLLFIGQVVVLSESCCFTNALTYHLKPFCIYCNSLISDRPLGEV